MKSYRILALTALLACSAGAWAQKMSPETEILLLKHNSYNNLNATTSPDVKRILEKSGTEALADKPIEAFVRVKGPWAIDELRAAGVKVNTVIDNIVTARFDIDLLPTVARMDGVERIEVGRKIELKNNVVRRRVSVNDVHKPTVGAEGALPRAYRGNGVIVGVIDVGFEYNHIAFRTDDGQDRLRVSRLWNQNSVGKSPEGYDYGAEYTTADQMRAARFDSDEYHGTHTTTTAAGSPIGSEYYGMAPESELVLVSVDLASDTHLTDAVKYIFDYADQQGKPCVVNMSLGSHNGPHDGNSIIDQTFKSLIGPGHILVGAVGNEAGVDMHCSKTFTETDKTLKTMLAYSDGYGKNTLTYIWGTPGTKFTVEVALVDPTRKGRVIKTSGEISLDSETSYHSLSEGDVTDISVVASPVVVDNNNAPQMALESYCYGVASNRKEAIIVHGEPGQTIHMWNAANNLYFVNADLSDYTKGDDLCTAGEIGGSGEAVISVGSYDSDEILVIPGVGGANMAEFMKDNGFTFTSGARSSFSSRGPTADGRMKPDVMAPGCFTVSGFNQYCTASPFAYDVLPTVTDKDGNVYKFEVSMGTSQATPVVTGIIALWLEANPDLTVDQIREILSRTCDRDSFTGDTPNSDTGYGKINAIAGMRDILGISSAIDDVTVSDRDTKVWFDPETREIFCVTPGAAVATVHNLSGVNVLEGAITADSRTLDGSSLAAGVYVVTVTGNNTSASFKIVVK